MRRWRGEACVPTPHAIFRNQARGIESRSAPGGGSSGRSGGTKPPRCASSGTRGPGRRSAGGGR
uniref:Uncharacterized protein n=1 Tax=Arundo donax TaxID=35708 RepID=A0A0A9D1A5_ARUDO